MELERTGRAANPCQGVLPNSNSARASGAPPPSPPPRSSPGAGAVSGLPYEFIVTPPRADGARRVNPQPVFAGALARKRTAPVSYRELSEGHCGGTAASACCEGSVPAAG